MCQLTGAIGDLPLREDLPGHGEGPCGTAEASTIPARPTRQPRRLQT